MVGPTGSAALQGRCCTWWGNRGGHKGRLKQSSERKGQRRCIVGEALQPERNLKVKEVNAPGKMDVEDGADE